MDEDEKWYWASAVGFMVWTWMAVGLMSMDAWPWALGYQTIAGLFLASHLGAMVKL